MDRSEYDGFITTTVQTYTSAKKFVIQSNQ